jgi:hypothetical protein
VAGAAKISIHEPIKIKKSVVEQVIVREGDLYMLTGESAQHHFHAVSQPLGEGGERICLVIRFVSSEIVEEYQQRASDTTIADCEKMKLPGRPHTVSKA